MKLSCDIRRRHHRCKRFSAAVHFRMEIFILAPFVIQFFFDRFRIISLYSLCSPCLSLIEFLRPPLSPHHAHSSCLRTPVSRFALECLWRADCIFRCSRNFHSCIKKRPLHNVKGEDSAVPPYFIHFLNPEQSAPVGNIPLESCNVDHSGTTYLHPALLSLLIGQGRCTSAIRFKSYLPLSFSETAFQPADGPL